MLCDVVVFGFVYVAYMKGFLEGGLHRIKKAMCLLVMMKTPMAFRGRDEEKTAFAVWLVWELACLPWQTKMQNLTKYKKLFFALKLLDKKGIFDII